jgi:hypothetical protein
VKLTPAQIAGYAAGAGFPSAQIPTAVAIALAESGGNPDDLGDVSLETARWGPSVGLWQIRSLKPAALAKASGADQFRDAAKLPDPAFNAQAARAIYGESGWHPWSTYPGTYLLYLPQGRAAAAAPATSSAPTSSATDSLGSIQPAGFLGDAGKALGLISPLGIPLGLLGNPGDMFGAAKQGVGLLANLVAFLAKAAVWMSDQNNWLRIIKVYAGSWLVLLGLAMTAWPALGPVVNAGATVIPAGKVAKVAAGAKAAGSVKSAPAPAPAA